MRRRILIMLALCTGLAPAEALSAPGNASLAASNHWAFQPLRTVAIPSVRNTRWPRNEVDRFILAALERQGLSPNPAAPPRILLRRLTFDLTGLPPDPAHAETFLPVATRDTEAARAALVERLLASPRYGEQWGRHWLDLARYADTAGDSADYPVPEAGRYRDYVIESFHRDRPYDQFLREQIAGDLLPASSDPEHREQVVATGFIAVSRRFGVAGTPHLTIEDTLDTMSKVVWGVSLACARCHDHKYDPFTTRDYYALYGVFSSTRYPFPGAEENPRQRDFVPLIPADEAAQLLQPFHEKLAELDHAVAKLEYEKDQFERGLAKDGRPFKEIATALASARKARDAFATNAPPVPMAYAVTDNAGTNARVQYRGSPGALREEVPRGFPALFGGQRVPAEENGSGRRQLAGWLTEGVSRDLAARVMMNRIWQHHFGRGLVRTPNDFGSRGQPPTHPELLDWLARRFIDSGWSVKTMHRLILSSATYQQTVSHDGTGNQSAPLRRRLQAEEIRDALLYLSGDLDLTPAGPHPFPPQGRWEYTQHDPFVERYDSKRRSVYLMQPRYIKPVFFTIFDGADPNVCTAERGANLTPLQALYSLNDPFVHAQAARLAGQLLDWDASDRARMDRLHQLCYARRATSEELAWGENFLRRAQQLAGPAGFAGDRRVAAWSSYVRALWASSEFLFLD